MRIYTEVNFEWDEKQGKLIEVSSDSYDYEGELSLADVSEWTTWKTVWYDSYGNAYKIRVHMNTFNNKVDVADVLKSTDGGNTWTIDKRRLNDNKDMKKSTAHSKFKNYVKSVSKSGEVYGTFGQDDKSKWEQYAASISGNPDIVNLSPDEVEEELEKTELEELTEEEVFEKKSSDIVLGEYLQDWKDIIEIGGLDDFEENIKSYIGDVKDLEEDIKTEYQNIFGEDGTLKQLQEDFKTSTERSEEDFKTGMRDIREDLSEGLEDTVTTREESLKQVREGAKENIRSAEAKIAASGFAATGVGKSARDLLAKEIGQDARSVDEAFTEDRSDIRKTYITEEESLQKTIGRGGTAYDDYKKERDRSGKEALKEWERLSTKYRRDVEGLEGLVSKEQLKAQEGLKNIGMDIFSEISATTEIYEDYDPFAEGEVLAGYDPETFGLSGIAGKYMYDPSVMGENLFTKDSYEEYKPSEDLKLYDPNVKMPWETTSKVEVEDEGVLPWLNKK